MFFRRAAAGSVARFASAVAAISAIRDGARACRLRALVLALGAGVAAPRASAQEPPRSAERLSCEAPFPDPIVHWAIDGRPVDVLSDRSGCFVFVTVGRDSGPSGVLVLHRNPPGLDSVRFIPVSGSPFGMRLSGDGKWIFVAAGDHVSIVDVAESTGDGRRPVIGVIRDSVFSGAVMANATPDGRLLFVSQERGAAISVFDLTGYRPADSASARFVGQIPTGRAPIALEFSPDGRRLFATAQEARPALNWPVECRPQANRGDPPDHVAGTVLVIDVARAAREPGAAVLATIKAGCNPVRLVLSPDGRRAYVTARTDDQLFVFDVDQMTADPSAAPLRRIPVGPAPVGVLATPDGHRVIVTSSNRFSGGANDRQELYVVNPAGTGAPAVIARVPAGAFPRQLHLAADGRTLYVTNFASQTLQVVDLARVP